VVGETDGAAVGSEDAGDTVGALVSMSVVVVLTKVVVVNSRTVGTRVGSRVGDDGVGSAVGTAVGNRVGCAVGRGVGDDVRSVVGSTVGPRVGTSVGAVVGRLKVGNADGIRVGDVLGVLVC
jgi:hypothetical protein